MTFLTPKTLAIHDGKPEHLHLGKSFFDSLKLSWLNDRDDEFHKRPYSMW